MNAGATLLHKRSFNSRVLARLSQHECRAGQQDAIPQKRRVCILQHIQCLGSSLSKRPSVLVIPQNFEPPPLGTTVPEGTT